MASFVQPSEDLDNGSSSEDGPMTDQDGQVPQHDPMDQRGGAVPLAEDDAASSDMTRGFTHTLFLDMSHLGPPFPAGDGLVHHPTGQAIRTHHLLTPSPSPVCWGSPSLVSKPWPCTASAASYPDMPLQQPHDPQQPSSTSAPPAILPSPGPSTIGDGPVQPLDKDASHDEMNNATLCLQYPSLYMGHPLVPDLEMVKAGYAEDLAKLHQRLAVSSRGIQMEYGKGM